MSIFGCPLFISNRDLNTASTPWEQLSLCADYAHTGARAELELELGGESDDRWVVQNAGVNPDESGNGHCCRRCRCRGTMKSAGVRAGGAPNRTNKFQDTKLAQN